MKRIFANKLSNTQDTENFRSHILSTSEINRNRLIEKNEKLKKSITARLLKNRNCKKVFDTKMLDAEQEIDVAKSQLICISC